MFSRKKRIGVGRKKNIGHAVRKNVPDYLHSKLTRKLKKKEEIIPVSRRCVKHIWKRHGNYQNAKQQSTIKRNKGKIPSHFRSGRVMAKSIIRTVRSANWVRPAGGLSKKYRGELCTSIPTNDEIRDRRRQCSFPHPPPKEFLQLRPASYPKQ